MERWERWEMRAADVRAALAPGEALLAEQGGVGMYDRQEKVPLRAAGTAVLTTHRLAYIDAARADQSCFVRLDTIRQTEHYAGFLKSSPKITVMLREQVAAPTGPWTCAVCGFQNTNATSLDVCALCGVARPADAAVAAPSSQAPATLPVRAPPASAGPEKGCARCTFLNHPAMTHCEMCEAPLAPAAAPAPVEAPAPVPAPTPAPAPTAPPYVKLSFRKGGDKAFYAQLRSTLQSKPWLAEPRRRRPAAGIDGVLTQDTAPVAPAPDAFQDLEALMKQARQMVDLAATLRTQLERRERVLARDGQQSHDDTGSMIQSALVQLGLSAPAVTPEMVKSEREYHVELARELASLLTAPNGMLDRGVLALDEVWGLWNRARGTGT